MTGYILSIVGVVFMGVLVDIISPTGKTNAFIKSIFCIFLLYVVLTPVINLLTKKNFNLTAITEMEINQDYLDDINNSSLENMQLNLEKMLEKNGFLNVDVEIFGYVLGENKSISKIIVNTNNLVLFGVDKHIDKYKVITSLIQQSVEVDESIIEYEK